MSIRVLLVDDHKLFLAGLRAVLEAEPGMEVIGEAEDGRSAIEAARKGRPDLVVMDLSMPDMNGVEATRQITAELPAVKVLCLSMHSEERFVDAALKSGASGYVLKDCDLDELLRAVRELAANRVYLSPAIGVTVLEAYKRKDEQGSEISAFSLLTAREREVLQLIAEGHSTPEIAERLGLSTKTIGTYREHLMEKLDIHSVAGLTKYAIREGLTSTTR
jgi:DNA-binding NarL/FixJ family response regulator